MKRLFDWLTRDPAALVQANAEIVWLREENRRLSDLLTQAWESSRVIPRQIEHTSPPAQVDAQPRTLADLQAELDTQAEIDRERYEMSETKRQAALRGAKEEIVN